MNKKIKIILFLIFLISSDSFAKNDETEKLLELSYQSFIYTKDIQNAYLLAKKATQKYPKNIEWKERLFQICIWSGKTEEALDILNEIYLINPETELIENYLKEIKNKRLDFYEKILKTKAKNGDKKYLLELFNFYISIGETEKIENLITENPILLKFEPAYQSLSEFYLKKHDPEKAIYYFEKSEKKNRCAFYPKVSNIYFSKQDFEKAQKVLKENLQYCNENPNFLTQLSDFSLLLNKFEDMIKASDILYKTKNYREIDAERLYIYYLNRDIKKASQIAFDAYLKFKKQYFLYYYLSLNAKDDYESLLKEVDLKDQILIYIKNFDKLNNQKRNNLLNLFIKEEQELNTVLNYIWIIIEKGNIGEKNAISQKYSCFNEKKDLFLALSFLKASINKTEEALDCFNKAFNYNPRISDYVNYGDFLYSVGFKTESIFYKKIAHNYLKSKNDKTEEEIKNFLRLSIELETEDFDIKKIENYKTNQKDNLELSLYFLSKNKMYEEVKKLINSDKSSPEWAKFFLINNEKDFEKFSRLDESLLSYNDKAIFYDYFNFRNKALENSFNSLNNSPNNFDNKTNYIYLINKYYPSSYIKTTYEDRDFSNSLSYELNFNKYFNKNIFWGTKAIAEKTNLSKDFYIKSNKKFYSFSFNLKGVSWITEIGLNNFINNFYYFKFSKRIQKPSMENITTLNYQTQCDDSFLLKLSGSENSISNYLSLKFFKNKFTHTATVKEYKDQNKNYLGNSITNQIGYKIKYRNNQFEPYFKMGNFNGSNQKNHFATYKIFKYYPTAIIPKDYYEYGLSSNLLENNFKRFSFPINLNISYNTKTNLNYYIEISLKSKNIFKLDWESNIRYSKSSSTNKDKIIAINLIGYFK